MGLLDDYSKQARAYDSTRSASPSVLAPLREALAGALGPALLDVGGGTGNYAAALAGEGWQPVVLDRSREMLEHAAAKRLETVRGEATELPFAEQSFDAVMLVSMLHHVGERGQALAEARRVLRPDGRLAVMLFTREDFATDASIEYFPISRAWMHETHPPLRELLDALPGARRLPLLYTDTVDGSLAALLAQPELLLDPARRAQTSFFERMQRDHPGELRAGLQRLESDLRAGRAPHSPGGASMIAWTKP
jgi:ubiquinone/menaquinone biosynthesis C-methylase UbiE